jgi:two-component system, sensor histidine kinase RegB
MARIPTKTSASPSTVQSQLIFLGTAMVLTVLLYMNGGATSPFASLYLVPIAIAAATLSARFTIALAAFCLLAYSLLMFYYQPLPFLSPSHEMVMNSAAHSMHMATDHSMSWHVVGMWLNFVVSTLLISYFVLRMARALRARDAELAAIREKQLRDEQLIGIATLAAGTLHELGTPLATMTLLTEEFKNAAHANPALAADASLLAEQLERCKLIMQNLAHVAQQHSDELRRVATSEYLDTVLANWSLLQPGNILKKQFPADCGFIRIDSTVEQAIINLLNNAAEASPAGIELSVQKHPENNAVTIGIRDHGPGISLAVEAIGKPFVSTRGPGRGLGLFLSNATIERLGGQVVLQAHADGGTLTTITLPGA